MSESSGADQFDGLWVESKAAYLAISWHLSAFARDHAVPIIFAPPLSVGGKINGASGSLVQLGANILLVTPSHVLAGYEERVRAGERLNWQVGDLPPFDPKARVIWRNHELDIVMLDMTDSEVKMVGPCIVSVPSDWPPRLPQPGDLVLVAGYPKALREEKTSSGWIGAGPYSALFKVTVTGQGYCKCVIERKDLVSFDGNPLPELGTDMGGLSGGPVFLVQKLNYPLVGIVTDRCEMTFAKFEIIQFATLDNVNL